MCFRLFLRRATYQSAKTVARGAVRPYAALPRLPTVRIGSAMLPPQGYFRVHPAPIHNRVYTLILVLIFEFSNGFPDTANAVATVIYTKSLKPVPAVIRSGLMNFAGG
jgi:hypothetical protein